MLKQQQYEPMPLAQEIATLFAAVNGYLAEVKVEEIRTFLDQMMQNLKYRHPALLEGFQKTGELSADAEKELREALDEFRSHKRTD